MNAKQFAEKAIIEGMKREYEDVDDIAESLSAGLIVLTEKKFTDALQEAFCSGMSFEDSEGLQEEDSWKCASRIMREVKGETK